MPTFEDMKKQYSPTVIGEQIKDMANMVMNETFSNTTTLFIVSSYEVN